MTVSQLTLLGLIRLRSVVLLWQIACIVTVAVLSVVSCTALSLRRTVPEKDDCPVSLFLREREKLTSSSIGVLLGLCVFVCDVTRGRGCLRVLSVDD